jgi:predicted metal-dependent enzyme (double-stranded beta helix superfamily)
MSPRIVHVDDVPSQEVRRQQHGPDPAATASVHERWLDAEGRFLALHARWDPGMLVQPHGHNSDHVVLVLSGSMTCGAVECRPGTHIASTTATTSGRSWPGRTAWSSTR